MGKTVTAVVGAALMIGIAIAAPMLAVGVLGFAAGSVGAAIASAVIATTLAIGVSLAMRAIVGAPSTKHATYPQGTAVVDAFGPPPNIPLEPTMPAIRGSWWSTYLRWQFGGGVRFYIIELVGDCMAPRITDRYAIADTHAEIRRGDLFSMGTRDLAQLGYSKDIDGISKRFAGVNLELNVLECDCLNPPMTIHAGLSNVLWAHRIRATAPTFKQAKRLMRAVRRRPGSLTSLWWRDPY